MQGPSTPPLLPNLHPGYREGSLLHLRPTCCPAPAEDPQHCSAPHCLSLAPRVLPVLTQLPLLAWSEPPGKTCPFPTAHPPTPAAGGPATLHEDPSPISQLGTAPSAQGLAGVTSPGSPARVQRAGRPPGPVPAGKCREQGISAAARRQPAAHQPHASSVEAALVPFGRTNTAQIDIWPKSSASESPQVSHGEDG